LPPITYGECHVFGGSGSWAIIHLYNFTETIHRKTITAYATNGYMGFGLDYPSTLNDLNGTNYMIQNSQTGTDWVDAYYKDRSHVDFTKSLIAHGWELGIHFSVQLNTLSESKAEAEIDKEMADVYNTFGKYPTTWCSLHNGDNITHAIYIYKKYGTIWRNGGSGVTWISNIGNVYDQTWSFWWSYATQHNAIYPTFDHQLDRENAIMYSLDFSKLKVFSDSYKNNGTHICGFNEYYLRGIAQNRTGVSILENDSDHMKFTVTTDNYPLCLNILTSVTGCSVYDSKRDLVPHTSTCDGLIIPNATNGTYLIAFPKRTTQTFNKPESVTAENYIKSKQIGKSSLSNLENSQNTASSYASIWDTAYRLVFSSQSNIILVIMLAIILIICITLLVVFNRVL
jgi:hypothetical protein